MQSVSSRIWTRVAVSISYDDNDYTTGTSIDLVLYPTRAEGLVNMDNIFKRAWAHFFLHTVKWFHLFLSITNNPIFYQSSVCSALNVFNTI